MDENLEALKSRVEKLETEQRKLREELYRLQNPSILESKKKPPKVLQTEPVKAKQKKTSIEEIPKAVSSKSQTKSSLDKWLNKPNAFEKNKLEKFIGENLISKLGILITLIGISIGVKYAIDNELINPLTRILLGYGAGIVLMVIGIRMRPKYQNYSAVLVSGAIASMYVVTYFAYSLYQLISQEIAFGLMVLFTIFTVIAAISYKKQVLAHIGLLGAYSVPFLLGGEPGGEVVLFSYISIINLGILVTCVTQQWRAIIYVALGLTWLIFITIYVPNTWDLKDIKYVVLGIATIYFLTFYAAILGYRFYKKQVFSRLDVVLIILNTLIYYLVGLGILGFDNYDYYGLFTAGNAAIHLIAIAVLFLKKERPQKAIYTSTYIFLVLVTLSILTGFREEWISVGLSLLTGGLYFLANNFSIRSFKKYTLPLSFLSFVVLISSWLIDVNINKFLDSRIASVVFFIVFGAILYGQLFFFNKSKEEKSFSKVLRVIIPVFWVLCFFFGWLIEIDYYFEDKLFDSSVSYNIENDTLIHFGTISKLIYSLLFLSLLILINRFAIRLKTLRTVNIFLGIILLFICLVIGTSSLEALKGIYEKGKLAEFYHITSRTIYVRYLLYGAAAVLIGLLFNTWKKLEGGKFKTVISIVLHLFVLALLSMEAIHLLETLGVRNSSKLALTIVWGVYSIYLVSWGIFKGRSYLRILGISIVGVSILKLFFYDIAHQSTISKTIVFIILGIVLLIISFLYNRTKKI